MCCVIFGILICLTAGNVAAEDASTTEISTTKSVQNVEYRPLTVGDTFTPSEMLPIAEKLMKKSGSLSGVGKGIVSSAPTTQHLAEKLFQGFFYTSNHIAVLKHPDIAGLDALQALALSGETANADFGIDFMASTFYKPKDQLERLQKVNCTYILLKKKVDRKRDKVVMRRALKIAEKLGKKRQLKVRSPRKPGGKLRRGSRRQNLNETENVNETDITYQTQKLGPPASFQPVGFKTVSSDATTNLLEIMKVASTTQNARLNHPENSGLSASLQNTNPKVLADFSPAPTTDTINENLKFKAGCHYTYECKRPPDMDSCRLYMSCDKRDHEEGLHIKHLEDEHQKNMKEFRKMLGINLIDEEVEKIIERRFMLFKPEKNPSGGESLQKLKEVEQYFHNIMALENGANTAPMSPTTESYRST